MSAQSNPPKAAMNLLFLPFEIGLLIYDQLFRSTRVRFGTRQNQMETWDYPGGEWDKFRSYRWKPARNALAILRACSQTHQEARSLWLSRILFFFDDTDALRRKLGWLSPHVSRQIRHVLLVHSGQGFLEALSGTKHLQLDTFTIFGAPTTEQARGYTAGQTGPVRSLRTMGPLNINVKGLKAALELRLSWKNCYYVVPEQYVTIGLGELHRHRDRDPTNWTTVTFDKQVIEAGRAKHGTGRLLKANILPSTHMKLLQDSTKIMYVNEYRCKRSRQNQQLLCFSLHQALEDALSEQDGEMDANQVPSFLPFIGQPAAGYAGTTSDCLIADQYRSILEYDWSAKWYEFPPRGDDYEAVVFED